MKVVGSLDAWGSVGRRGIESDGCGVAGEEREVAVGGVLADV